MQAKLIWSALFAALAALLLDPDQAPRLLAPLRQGVTWAAAPWPNLALADLDPLLNGLPMALGILLLLLIPIIWLKPN
jgi:hypothetical protein